MDISSVLAFKSCFLGMRAKGTLDNIKNKQNCTALANATRVAVSASQGVVPLVCFANKIAPTSPGSVWGKIVKNTNINNIANAINSKIPIKTSSKIPFVAKLLSKFGLGANIVYTLAQPVDAKESKKSEVFMGAMGNLCGMYLFENMYQHAVDKIPNSITNKFSSIFSNLNIFPKSVKPVSILIGLGFVCASLLGCNLGSKLFKWLHKDSNGEKIDKEYERLVENNPKLQNISKKVLLAQSVQQNKYPNLNFVV